MPDSIETVGDILDQQRRTIGGNNPPLAEILVEETKTLKERADELIATAGLMVFTDDDSYGRGATLVKMMMGHARDIDAAREVRKKPILEDGRTVDRHFKTMAALLIGDNEKVLGGAAGPLDAKIDARRRQREAEAAAERARLEEEARQQRELARKAEEARLAAEAETRRAAIEAQRKIEEAEAAAAAAGHRALADKLALERAWAMAAQDKEDAAARERKLQAEIDQRNADDAAAALERRAAETKAAPITSGYGVKASGRKKYIVVIDDLTIAIKHCRKISEEKVREAIQAIYDKQANAGIHTLPGATVTEDSKTTYR